MAQINTADNIQGGYVDGSFFFCHGKNTDTSNTQKKKDDTSNLNNNNNNNNNNNITFINCNWVVTQWQWLFYMYTNMKKN